MRQPPRWKPDLCPPWCVSEHDEDDLPADQFHDSAGAAVPVIICERADVEQPYGTDLLLTLVRRFETREDWLHLSAPEAGMRGVTLTLESARRLGQALLNATDSPV